MVKKSKFTKCQVCFVDNNSKYCIECSKIIDELQNNIKKIY